MKISKEIFLCFSVILTTNILTVHGQCTFLTATSSSQYLESHSSYGSFHYSSNEDKCWIIQTSDFTKVVEIYRSDTFQLESYQSSSCSYDKLQVYDSSTTSGSSVNFCGTNIFTYLWSSGSSMYLRFKTDSSNNYDGFRIRYKQVSSSSYSSSRWSSSYYSYSSSSTNYSSTTSSFLSIGTIIGIVMGVIVFIIVIVIVCVVICVGAASSRGRRVGVVRGANTTVITQQQQMQRPVGAQPYPAPAYSTGPAPLPQPYSTGPAPPPGGPGAPPSQYPPPPPPAYTSPAYPPPSYGVNPAAGGPPPPADGPPSNYPS